MRRFTVLFLVPWAVGASVSFAAAIDDRTDRSPVDLVLAPDNAWLATANQTSSSVSLVRTRDGKLLDEANVGSRPAAIALHPDGRRLLVSGSNSGQLSILRVADNRLETLASIQVGFEPHGIAVAPDGRFAYLACTADATVAVVDLEQRSVVDRIAVGRWPRHLAISPDGSRLAVGASGDGGVSVVDARQRKLLYTERFGGLNIGHLQIPRDGAYVYFPWVVYRGNPIDARNIRLGWVLATRIARVRLDGPARREAVSLDPPGKAIADPHGLALTSDEQRLVVSASGTHELLVYRAVDLPLQDHGGTDHVPRELLADRDRFFRVELGGRPMGLRIGNDDREVFVANYLENSVQVVDLQTRRLARSISLGGAREPSLARRGEAIFYDARRSLDQWYSCHTCHYQGGANSVAIDTLNDDTLFTFKTVPPLYRATETGPWTWHGWQTDLRAAMKKSLTSTMLGQPPTAEDTDALIAHLKGLQPPPNPFRRRDGSLRESARRGKKIFEGELANCSACHHGPNFTDGEIHDVGTSRTSDRYQGFNTPTLIGVHRRIKLLHDGRADSLEELLTGPHSPAKVSGASDLSEKQVRNLAAYLRSL